MEDSILKSVKEMLGYKEADSGFETEIATHINAAFSTLEQLGLIPSYFEVTGETETWTDTGIALDVMGMARSYVFLKTKSLFDPPTLSFMITMQQDQLREFEVRLNTYAEVGNG